MNQSGFLDIIAFGPTGWGAALVDGAAMTVAIAISGFLLGGVIGLLSAWAKIAGGNALQMVANGYTTIFRGVPELLIIYLFYFGGSALVSWIAGHFGATGFVGLPGYLAGSLAIGAISGAFHTEIFRGAYLVVNPGEIEAARACGMSRMLRLRRIIAPLTLRNALPGLGNVWQMVLKDSALVSVTGAVDILRQAQIGAGSTGLPFDFFFIAAALYLAISTASAVMLRVSERRLQRGVRRG